MALSHSLIQFMLSLRRQQFIGAGPAVRLLEFGEQNWFYDVRPEELPVLIGQFQDIPEERRAALLAEMNALLQTRPATEPFDLSKVFYKLVFNYSDYTAIDLHGSESALKLDLNEPLGLPEHAWDVVTNIGTTEHVFNQYQAFKSLHQLVKPGGLILHSLPNQGCFDHGFFNYHPTFFYDLAVANGYEILALIYVDCSQIPHQMRQLASQADYVRLAVGKQLSSYSGLICLYRTPGTPRAFQAPRQGYYDNRLPPELQKAWNELAR
ncbi:class I SAM-dependent methyltransferase [Roseateles sp. DB2]|uniref:class I SAM-dependent methyltransferase n=1 Tax=Roseateles sp. DB2 TaxID=3453717 RepID=UPI003EE9BD8A